MTLVLQVAIPAEELRRRVMEAAYAEAAKLFDMEVMESRLVQLACELAKR